MESNQEIQKQVEFLYDATAKQLYNLALYIIGNPEEAEKITIDAFCRAFYNTPDKTDVNLFKEQSVKLLYKFGRKIRKKHEYNGNMIFIRAEEDVEKQVDVRKTELIDMLSCLKYSEKYILLLFCWQKFSIQQIAKAICLPVFLTKKRFEATVTKAVTYKELKKVY